MLDFVRGGKKWYWVSALGLVCVGVILFVAFGPKATDESYSLLPRSFDGPSDSLRQTIVVPTLDSPLPKGKSAIWCASFQLAWDRMKSDVAKGPIRVQNAETVCTRLNDSEFPQSSLDPKTYYAAAGFAKDGIATRIEAEMRERFPDVVLPELTTPPDSAVAYGYLKAGVRYTHPFFENDQAFTFTDSAGVEAVVKSFGFRMASQRLRGQVGILYFLRDGKFDELEIKEFVLDLCKDSYPLKSSLRDWTVKPLSPIPSPTWRGRSKMNPREVSPGDPSLGHRARPQHVLPDWTPLRGTGGNGQATAPSNSQGLFPAHGPPDDRFSDGPGRRGGNFPREG